VTVRWRLKIGTKSVALYHSKEGARCELRRYEEMRIADPDRLKRILGFAPKDKDMFVVIKVEAR